MNACSECASTATYDLRCPACCGRLVATTFGDDERTEGMLAAIARMPQAASIEQIAQAWRQFEVGQQ